MQYKITIAVEGKRDDDSSYKSYNTVFEQLIEDPDLSAIIKAVNKFA